VIVVVLPASQQIARADAAVGRLAAVEVPGPGGEVDGVAGVVHGHVGVVVAVVLVGRGALGTVWGEDVSGMGEERRGLGRAYQSPLLNSLALRKARGKRGVAETAALKATMVAKRDVACMVIGLRWKF
jgi:hypothetical protein